MPVRFGGGEAALILRVGGGESGSRGRREIGLGPEAVVSGGLMGDGGRAEGGGGGEGSGG